MITVEARLGRKRAQLRYEKERNRWAGVKQSLVSKLVNGLPFYPMVELVLRCTGLWGRACREFLNLQLVHHEVTLSRLPAAFDGFRILQLTDLHSDLEPKLIDAVIESVRNLDYNLAVITGDFRNHTKGTIDQAVAETTRVVAALKQPVYGVMGNHDSLAMVPGLEAGGLRILLNEHISIEREGARLWIAGVDDCTHYHTDDMVAATTGIPTGDCVVLLSHGAECHAEAEARGISLMLSGHTHGGQICLPNGYAPMRHDEGLQPGMFAGAWSYKTLMGYTSRGTGGTRLPVRLNCPAEITVHTLRKG